MPMAIPIEIPIQTPEKKYLCLETFPFTFHPDFPIFSTDSFRLVFIATPFF